MLVRRVTPTHSQPLKRARNIIPVHPRNNHEDSQAPGSPDHHTTSGSPIAPPYGMRFVIPSQCPLIRFPGLTRPHKEADNPLYRSPSDLFHLQYCNIPGIDALPTYDENLWQRTQMTSEELEEFKEHLRRINALIFSWLVTIYRLILFFTWYTTVCAFPSRIGPSLTTPKASISRLFVVKVLRIPWAHRAGTTVSTARWDTFIGFSFVYLTHEQA